MTKGTRLNLRISDAFKEEIQQLADYHGLTMSSYAHSLLVKAIRREREATPEAFPAKVVGRIEPGLSREEIQRQLEQGIPLATHSSRKMPTKLDETTTTRRRRTR